MPNPSLPHGLRPISEAPVKEGEPYGPCLFITSDGWDFGEWDGECWWSFLEGGEQIEPSYFVFLGSPPP